MRNFCLTFILLFPIFVEAQIQPNVIDDFSDGDFTENPTWSGTTSLFTVNAEKQLVVNEYVDGIAYLSTFSRIAVNATWQIDLGTDSTTSASNLVKFYLISDNQDLTGELNGYYIVFGNTKDEIALYKQQGKNTEKIIDGRDGISEEATISIKITNDDKGNFTLYSKLVGETDYFEEGTIFDESFISKSNYAGISIKYSKTYASKYLFDNISFSGEKIEDLIAPTILSVDVINKKQISIAFSEQVSVNPSLTEGIETMTLNNAKNTLLIELQKEINEGEYKEIILPIIKDLEENELKQQTINVYVPKTNDIVINEIMADPTPHVALPEAKYIELYNRTNYPIPLKGFQLNIGTKNYTIENGIINPKSYLLICTEKDATLFEEFNPKILASNISSLTISGTTVSLTSNLGTTIDCLEYSDSWYGNDEFKKDGGWSLERIDVDNFYASKNNWKASNDKRGGTPCQKNSIAGENLDTILPVINNYYLEDESSIVVTFSKSMQLSDLTNIENYSISSGIEIKSANILSAMNNGVLIELEEGISSDIIDTLIIKGIKDISGLTSANRKLPISLPQTPTTFSDIIINEILFNPIGDGADFIELFNPTEQVWNLSEVFITNRKGEDLQKRIAITEKNELFFPNEYIVLTKDPENIKSSYSCSSDARFYTISLPSLPDAEGNIILVAKDETIFDEFDYTEKMHHAFVSNKEGVSLERINPSLPTQSADSWQSAASVVGYATPGYQNSQYYDNKPVETKKLFELERKSFSPDNDGYNDLLLINYQMEEDGFSASISIYSADGILVRKLYNNQLLPTQGTLFWDGTNDSGAVSQIGVYVAYIEYLHPKGKKGKQKLVFSLTSK
ncbi:MAG: lamin tail domain-containing protein [Paludibacteraceae bacterium]|nr:lamin tail domain-containing protein [Paludibacteraceae bacterium]